MIRIDSLKSQQGHLNPFMAEDIQALRNKVAEILMEDKDLKMAVLAGIE